MPSKIYTRISYIISVLLGLCIVSVNAQNSICNEALMIVKTAEKHHFQPRAVDNEFSELVFSGFIKLLDPYGIYLSKSELEELEEAKYSIDDEIINQKCYFLTKATDLYSNKLRSIDSMLRSFEAGNFDYTIDDSITIIKGRVLQSDHQMRSQWERLLKLQVLTSYFSTIDSVEKSRDEIVERLHELEKTAIRRQQCRIKSKISYHGGLEKYTSSLFLKAVSMAFDPHTLYFTRDEAQAFSGSLSKEAKSFGFYVSGNDFGEIEVVDIVPGGPSWKSNALNIGDVILKVTTSDIEKDFDCIDIKEAMDFLASEETEKAEFLVRKKNGEAFELNLQKEKIDVQENIIQSFLLEGKAKTGYIYLPSFYSQSDADNYSYEGCANDVARELIRLKKEGISGLIFDLRDNGGGAMLEAILLSGLFIDYGALSISQSRGEEPSAMKDMNRGTIYDGPLIVLINNFSASASELFAAAMQDYNRAVIVGTKSFGKSSMQEIVPIDAYRYNNLETYRGTPRGYLKLTSGVFYRVSGKSFQTEGVIPDIFLPSVYANDQVGECSFPSALAPVSTDKKTYYYPLKALPVETLKDLSTARLMNDSVFAVLNSKNDIQQQEGHSLPIEFEAFKQYYSTMKRADLHEEELSFSVKYPSYFERINWQLEAYKDLHAGSMSRIARDIYIGEAYSIMNDLIHLTNKTD